MRNFRRLVLFCSVFIFYVLAPTERSPFFLLLPRFGIRLLRAHSFFSLRFWLSVYFIHHPNRVSFYLASVLLAAWERKPSGDVWQCRPLRCLHGVWLLSVSLFFFLVFFSYFSAYRLRVCRNASRRRRGRLRIPRLIFSLRTIFERQRRVQFPSNRQNLSYYMEYILSATRLCLYSKHRLPWICSNSTRLNFRFVVFFRYFSFVGLKVMCFINCCNITF